MLVSINILAMCHYKVKKGNTIVTQMREIDFRHQKSKPLLNVMNMLVSQNF